ncbi:hypothetical protein [Streptomyces sp. NPDC054783]
MDDVIAHPTEKPSVPYAETGWAKARRRRNRGVRTCLPAVVDRGSARRLGTGSEENIVRGED